MTLTARQLIAMLRDDFVRHIPTQSVDLLADLAEEGLASLRALIECECGSGSWAPDWWNTLDCENADIAEDVQSAVALLDRAGEIERHPERPELIRFK